MADAINPSGWCVSASWHCAGVGVPTAADPSGVDLCEKCWRAWRAEPWPGDQSASDPVTTATS